MAEEVKKAEKENKSVENWEKRKIARKKREKGKPGRWRGSEACLREKKR